MMSRKATKTSRFGQSLQPSPTPNTFEERKKFLIVCEGEKTEPHYFRAFPLPKEVVEIKGTGYNTLSLVETALKDWKKNEQFDSCWVVMDKDSFSDDLFNRAIDLAKANKIKIAYSNEAFELWYLLHFDYHDTAISRADYRSKLTVKLNRPYEKAATDMYKQLESRQETASKNAERLFRSYESKDFAKNNPSTTVHYLVQQLNEEIEKHSRSCR